MNVKPSFALLTATLVARARYGTMRGLSPYWGLVREGIAAFLEDDALTRGAAIAFYAVTAIAPTLFIAVTIASIGFGREAARVAILEHFRPFMSRESLDVLQLAVRNAPGTSTGLIGSVLGLLTLVLTASGVFGEMEDALNAIWRAPRKGAVLTRLIRGRAVSLLLVIGLGFLLLFSMVLTTAIAAIGTVLSVHAPVSRPVLALAHFAVSTALMSLVFAAIYKIVPNLDIEWRDVMGGAIGTALLFQLGQFVIGFYFANTRLGDPYGAAGGMIVLLFWTYYSAQVFLLGAEFTKAYALRFGSQRDDRPTQNPPPAVIARAA